MKRYEFFEHTADIGMCAFGKTQAELFENAARGLYAAMGEFVAAGNTIEHELELSTTDAAELLVDFLRELLFLFDTRRLVFTQFEWQELDTKLLCVTLRGAKADFEKSVLRTELKAVTYHCLKVQQKPEGWEATVIFDV